MKKTANLQITKTAAFSSARNAPLLETLTQQQFREHSPRPQPHWTFAGSRWQASEHDEPGGQQQQQRRHAAAPLLTSLRVITWNIDFMAPQPQARMAPALAYLQGLVDATPAPTAVVVMLQELMQTGGGADPNARGPPPRPGPGPGRDRARDLAQIAAAGWVRARLRATDLTTEHWRCQYNSVTLVDRRLALGRVARLAFVSDYDREALLADVGLERAGAGGEGEGEGGERHVLRLCNVHLDSLSGLPPLRYVQWRACARYLQDRDHGVVAGVLAGDCNANQTYDEVLPRANGLRDAYLELGGAEGDPEGLTWGHQSRTSRYPAKRMDKVCFCCQEEVLRVTGLQRIGVGVRVEDEEALVELKRRGFPGFVTDHYGLMADFELGGSWRFSTGEP